LDLQKKKSNEKHEPEKEEEIKGFKKQKDKKSR
jgi:hypothetical protein